MCASFENCIAGGKGDRVCVQGGTAQDEYISSAYPELEANNKLVRTGHGQTGPTVFEGLLLNACDIAGLGYHLQATTVRRY